MSIQSESYSFAYKVETTNTSQWKQQQHNKRLDVGYNPLRNYQKKNILKVRNRQKTVSLRFPLQHRLKITAAIFNSPHCSPLKILDPLVAPHENISSHLIFPLTPDPQRRAGPEPNVSTFWSSRRPSSSRSFSPSAHLSCSSVSFFSPRLTRAAVHGRTSARSFQELEGIKGNYSSALSVFARAKFKLWFECTKQMRQNRFCHITKSETEMRGITCWSEEIFFVTSFQGQISWF